MRLHNYATAAELEASSHNPTSSTILNWLSNAYNVADSPEMIRARLKRTKLQQFPLSAHYCERVLFLCLRLNPDMPEEERIQYLLAGVPSSLRFDIWQKNYATTDEVIAALRRTDLYKGIFPQDEETNLVDSLKKVMLSSQEQLRQDVKNELYNVVHRGLDVVNLQNGRQRDLQEQYPQYAHNYPKKGGKGNKQRARQEPNEQYRSNPTIYENYCSPMGWKPPNAIDWRPDQWWFNQSAHVPSYTGPIYEHFQVDTAPYSYYYPNTIPHDYWPDVDKRNPRLERYHQGYMGLNLPFTNNNPRANPVNPNAQRWMANMQVAERWATDMGTHPVLPYRDHSGNMERPEGFQPRNVFPDARHSPEKLRQMYDPNPSNSFNVYYPQYEPDWSQNSGQVRKQYQGNPQYQIKPGTKDDYEETRPWTPRPPQQAPKKRNDNQQQGQSAPPPLMSVNTAPRPRPVAQIVDERTCFYCGQVGHLRRQCPLRLMQPSQGPHLGN